jgi:hypothetical protein
MEVLQTPALPLRHRAELTLTTLKFTINLALKPILAALVFPNKNPEILCSGFKIIKSKMLEKWQECFFEVSLEYPFLLYLKAPGRAKLDPETSSEFNLERR